MVKFRGIDVSLVSQFDIRKLPEFAVPSDQDPFEPSSLPNDTSIASCYVPIYPGSQIWLEYSIDAPHPPKASYFFKLLHNGKVVTSFDCTSKHDYHGKAIYNFEYIGNDNFTGMPLVKRQAFKFSEKDGTAIAKDFMGDCIEVRVHRIEHRKRIPVESSFNTDARASEDSQDEGFCLVNGGPVDAHHLQRRYKYQLLDPVSEPYATFRFYYRSYEFLEQQHIVQMPSPTSPQL